MSGCERDEVGCWLLTPVAGKQLMKHSTLGDENIGDRLVGKNQKRQVEEFLESWLLWWCRGIMGGLREGISGFDCEGRDCGWSWWRKQIFLACLGRIQELMDGSI
jgi:hypothetical protein